MSLTRERLQWKLKSIRTDVSIILLLIFYYFLPVKFFFACEYIHGIYTKKVTRR